MIYHAHIQSHVLYGLLLWGNSVNKSYVNKVSSLLNDGVRIVASSRNASTSYTMLKILPLKRTNPSRELQIQLQSNTSPITKENFRNSDDR